MPDDPKKLQAAYEGLVEGFLLPLLEGGQVTLGRPLAPGCASFFAATTPSSPDVCQRIYQALCRSAADVADVSAVPFPGPALVSLAAAAHNLLALTDPSLDRVLARGARPTILAWTDRWLDLVPLPTTRGDALARHAIVEPLLAMQRRDVVVKNWAYTYRFFGRTVPANVVALPRLRFVRTTESTTAVRGLLERSPAAEELALGRRLRTLVARSPVTELLRADELGGFRIGLALLATLSDPALRSGLARKLAEREGALGPVIASALGAPTLRAEPAYLALAVQLLLELHLVVALDARTPTPRADEPLSGGVAAYAALLVAAFDSEDAIAHFRTLDHDDRAALQRRAEALRRALPDAVLEDARAILAAAARA